MPTPPRPDNATKLDMIAAAVALGVPIPEQYEAEARELREYVGKALLEADQNRSIPFEEWAKPIADKATASWLSRRDIERELAMLKDCKIVYEPFVKDEEYSISYCDEHALWETVNESRLMTVASHGTFAEAIDELRTKGEHE